MPTSAESAHARSLTYGFFARTLVYPDSEEWLPELVASPQDLAQLLAAAGLPGNAGGVERVEKLRDAFRVGEERGTLREECVRLFGNLRGAGCSPYETEFSNAHVFQRAQQMADIAGFYRAFGLQVSSEGERVDHIAAELEFMHFLTCKEAHAAGDDPSLDCARDREKQELCRSAQGKFLADHLGRWLGIFAQGVARTTTEAFYVELARLLDEFVAADAAALGACPERITAPPPRRAPEEEEERASCGEGSAPGEAGFVELSQIAGSQRGPALRSPKATSGQAGGQS